MANKATKSRTKKGASATNRPASSRLIPPKNGAVIRMYRIGHGDCFLLAFDGKTPKAPVYVLVDCGYKPGSADQIVPPTDIKSITNNIREATGGKIDVAILTHEHQDHVNGITEKNFAGIKIGETWLAWTEDPDDDLANTLRRRFKDKLLGLVNARDRLAADGNRIEAEVIDELLAFELGGEDKIFNVAAATALLGAAGKSAMSMNKKSMQVFKDLAKNGVKFIRPHEQVYLIPGAKNARAFALGPPRDDRDILDVNPRENEEFHGLAAAQASNLFAAAFTETKQIPFAKAFCLDDKTAFLDSDYGKFFTESYGKKGSPELPPAGVKKPGDREIHGNPGWRRIDNEWVFSALQLAIDVNNATNNTSLVLAFELGKGGKVLLFAADAQRGNWNSWAKKTWKDGENTITAKDLLGRTVLYKVGHHGSHNATLNGTLNDEHANLSWMGNGEYAREFTAMITAVRAWAETQKGWDHPLKAIKDALLKKCSGRVFQTDTDVVKMKMSNGQSQANWASFQSRVTGDPLFFDFKINA
jgi:beta-lactamase superfamily II metal-dependent hydrolase